jgi:2-oxo-4-hydroxy-4-carboxy--5-ureidoimidazoline (OHCU) decarboxylase
MLEILERRLLNASDAELKIAAEEQRRITRLRLATLLTAERLPTT